MQTVVSRPQPLAPSSSRGPRKSSSFTAGSREKPKSAPTPAEAAKASYFDAYPRPAPPRPPRSKARQSPSSSPSTRSPPVAFPSVDSFPAASPYSSTRLLERSRSFTGPPPDSWTTRSGSYGVPDLRLSGSSTQHTETPPETPVDIFDSTSFRDFAVFVSAPVSGVEMMDALVDGMNGAEDEPVRLSGRQRFGVPGHHPLYEPPLPTPPPGVVLGAPKQRKQPSRRHSQSSDSGSEEEVKRQALAARPRRRRPRPSPSRANSNSTILSPQTPVAEKPFPSVEDQPDPPRVVAPSISDIIRTHAPQTQLRSRPSVSARSSVYTRSQGHSPVQEETEPELIPMDEDMISRSSVDSIADEIRQTLRAQTSLRPTPKVMVQPSASFRRYSTFSDTISVSSPRSDGGAASLYAPSIMSNPAATSPVDSNFLSLAKPSASQAVAQYLRSARLTTLLKLIRSPHASPDHPLTVSLSDLGSPTGFPVVIFLGLGCVRHIMGLYDDMAACLGLRLITIDRWGLGRTEARSKASKGVMQWASVVEEVLDQLHITECSVMAHSAGTPYALSFANKSPKRIRGDICLLAPWVGGSENSGYKWLKYVPNGILKTAQAAEWKIQAWMIGKPPTIAYEGIGYTAAPKRAPLTSSYSNKNFAAVEDENRPRPSMGSTFSEYDDLRDFDGRFESKSTLAASNAAVPKRKPSRGFLNILIKPTSPIEQGPKSASATGGKKLKALRSMGSLRGKSSASRTAAKRSEPSSPQLPPAPKFDVGLGFEDMTWLKGTSEISLLPETGNFNGLKSASEKFYDVQPIRAGGRRSMSFTAASTYSSPQSPSSPIASSYNTSSTSVQSAKPNNEYQSTLGNALIAASHAESSRGMHNDLVQILNHDNHPWGFSYTHYPHRVCVWYGDKDEKIAENAVRWMERNMGEDKCTVKVVKNADHALMYKSSVVVEVLEQLLAHWQPDY
ncbi:hypothetical protein MKEN_00781200 [Mycena kentingensis (nom. inval.)]|nr:hypothetical protein MKEN_00781200 [Mycena kentingensis (nom. inval.)]